MIAIIIVNWNAGEQLCDVVSSVATHHGCLVSSVIIVDNASNDGSIERVETLIDLPFNIQIIRNTENLGFGRACNQGATLADSEYLLFLNPDTLLFDSSLTVPIAFMQQPENVSVGIVGIQLVDENSHIARSCSRFPSVRIFLAQALGFNRLPSLQHLSQAMVEWDHASTRQVDQVIGAFFLVRRSVFVSVGGFDERFFVYFEEVDFSFRTRQAGYRSVYLAEAQAFHAGGGTSQQVKAHRLFYSIRSRLLYGFKHFKLWQAWLLLVVSLGVEPISRVIFAFIKGTSEDVRNTLNAYRMLYCDLPETLKKALRS